MWFKKKSILQAEHHYDTEKSADGTTDMRTTDKSYYNTNSSIDNSGLPSAADADKYFYLPTLGFYDRDRLRAVGILGDFWSSSAKGTDGAYYLSFGSGFVGAYGYDRKGAFRVEPTFE